jgi:two-component system, OmpR family, sensor kinase
LLLLAAGISGSICWYLARTVTRPVERLQASARALANGNLDARVGDEFSSRKDELSVLAHDFDQMADRLRNLIDSKEVLLRDVSHELRTPLARLRLALGLARREGANLEREHDRIEREAERLDELIGEILRLGRLNNSQQDLHQEQIDYAGLVAEIVEDARIEAAAQNKQVTFDFAGELKLQGDAELLRSAIENVVRNALRYTEENTAVEVALEVTRQQAVLTIRDHGPGVPEAELTRLFEPFYRVTQQARERDTGGYGLGLAITSRVMSVHHGSVSAQNAAEGGLIVTLTVPVK